MADAICGHCGAVVADMAIHDAWHDAHADLHYGPEWRKQWRPDEGQRPEE